MKLVSMLRGINVGGSNRIKMGDLIALYDSIGLREAKTYLQSGNVVFEAKKVDQSKLEASIQKKIKESFSLDVPVLIRSGDELEALVRRSPFRGKDTSKLYVTFLSKKSQRIQTVEIDSVKSKGEEYRFAGREIYLYLSNGYGVTKLSNNYFEKKLDLSATTRNWNTVLSLLAMTK